VGARVAEDLHTQYLRGFDPPKRDGAKTTSRRKA